MAPFADRSFRVEDRRRVVADATVDAATLRHLTDAVRERRHSLSIGGLQDADAVFVVRGLTALADRLDGLTVLGDPVPVTMDRDEAVALAESAVSYGTSRDTEGYLPPAERERVDRLDIAADALMDVIADLAGAEAEAAENQLIGER